MSISIMNRPHGDYSKLDKEDPEDVLHRRAQFLIYKVMQRADDSQRPAAAASFSRIKLCKLKVKIGKRLKKLRRGVVLSMSAARLRVYRMIRIQWKRLFGCSGRAVTVGEITVAVAAAGGGVLPASSILPSM